MKPRPIRSLATVFACAALFSLPLRAATIDDLVASLRVEIEKGIAEAKGAKPGSAASSAYEADRLMARLESGVAKENYEEVEQSLTQLAVTRLSIEAKERISQLQREVPKVAVERQKAFAANVGAAIEKAGKACLAAKSEGDLDAVLGELATLKKQRAEGGNTYSEPRQRLNTRLDGATRFINRWQDYLVQTARGYDSSARNVLRELADPASSQYYPILPRADIIERIGKEQEVTAEDVLRGIKTLDEIPKAVADLARLSRESSARASNSFEFNGAVNELNQIARGHAAFKAGNYGAALLSASQWEGGAGLRSPESLRLKTLLVLEVLPRYLELEENPSPKAGENPSEFLLRLATESAAQEDWARVARILDTYRLIAFGTRTPPAWVSAEFEASQQFASARNLEQAGRYVQAILAYQRAVKTSGKYSPQKMAASKLAELEKTQPAAFAEAGKEPQVRELLDALRPVVTPRGLPSFDQ